MHPVGYMRLVVAIIAQAVEDVRHPVVWESEAQYRAQLRERLREEALAWLRDSSMVDLAAASWGLEREELVGRVARETERTRHPK